MLMKKQRKIKSGTGWNQIIVWMVVVGLFWAKQVGKAQVPFGSAKQGGSLQTPQQEAAALKKEERELAERIMKEFPDSEGPIILMGNVLQRHGNAAESLKLWKKALEMNPKRADIYKSMGWLAMGKGKYEEAIAYWRKALEIQPQLADVHNAIARALMGLGRGKDAIEELEKDIQISPRSSTSYFLLGQGYLQQKEYEKAKKNYEMAIILAPNFTNAYYGLFTACARLKQTDLAQKYKVTFERLKDEDMKVLKDRNDAHSDLVEMRKGVAETYMSAGQIYLESATGGQRAEELFKRATVLDPNNTAPLVQLAAMYQKNNRAAEAIEMFKKVVGIEPDNLPCLLNIGLLYSQLRRTADAEESFRKVISLAPKSSNGYRELAQLYLKMGIELKQARQLAEKAVELEPIAVNYMVLSRACDKNGDMPGALAAIKRAVELEPANARYQEIYQKIRQRK